MKLTGLLSVLVLIGFSSAADAESGTKEEQAACRPDVRKFCSSLPKGSGEQEYRNCLQFNFAGLSPKCQAVITAHQNR
jgi:hypothetical protein